MENATMIRRTRATKKPVAPSPAEVRLRSGLEARVRPILPEDEIHLRDGLEHLSPQSRYQRFLVTEFHPTDANFHYLSHPDFEAHLCLVMETIPTSKGDEPRGIAVARSIRGGVHEHGDDSAEFAIVVADEYQAQGAGPELLRALSDWAYATGVRRWHSLMLAENDAVLHAASAIADLVDRKFVEPGVVECVFALRDPALRDSVH